VIELRLLGEIRLRSSTGEDLDPILRQPKRLALLAYLAAPNPGTWHRRDLLLALFWPDLDAAHARTSLRSSLYVLRQTLGDEVLRSRGDEELSVNPDLLSTDLAVVWDDLRNGRPEEALAHYGGDLLPGLFPPGSDGFDRWRDAEQTRLRMAIVTSANARLCELEQGGDFPGALAIARRLADVEPDDETIVRKLMSLLDRLGDRAGGLAVFENYRTRLAGDFEAEPSPETIALANRLRAPAVPASPVVHPPLVRRAVQPHAPIAVEPEPHVEETASRAAPVSARRRVHPIAAGGATVAAIALLAVVISNRPTAARMPVIGTSSPVTAEEGLQIEPAISPNGRLVAYANGNKNRLKIFVQKIGGGSRWPLTSDSSSYEILPRWSPDNDELLFLSHNNAYVSPSLGGAPRLVVRGSEADGKVRSASWSPDGDSIAIVRNDSLTVHPLEGSGSRFVGHGKQVHSCVWSPNGKWIACTAGNWLEFEPGPLFGNDAPSAIVLFPSAGGQPVALTSSEFQNRSPAWSPDGKFLWFLSNRGGVTDEAYSVAIDETGKAGGPFVRVGLKAEWIALAASRIAYSVPVRKANVWWVPIPADTAIGLSAAKPLTSGNQVIEVLNASRDGKWLVYDSNLHGGADIYRVPTGGGPSERLTDDARPEYAGDLSPDDSELAWQRFINGERHLFVKRLDGDSAKEIIPAPGDQGVPHWAPDGSALAAWSHNKEEGTVFVVRRDSHGGWRRPSWKLRGAQLPVWSGDGRAVAFVRYDGSIQTISADSGARNTVYTPRPNSSDPLAVFLNWHFHAATIWFMGVDVAGHAGIWSVALPHGRPRLLVDLADPQGRQPGPSLATDGARFFFTLDERFSNVRWAELVKQ
jgi:serine/threonine-protein kinase